MLSLTEPQFSLGRLRNCLTISVNGWLWGFWIRVEILMAYFKFFMID